MGERKTISDIKSAKKKKPLVCLTAYTTPTAKILDPHCDILLVGDSLGMVLYGMESTRGVSLEMMIEHGKAVMRAKPDAFVVIDMPYGSYETSPKNALDNAKRVMKETGADAVKIEGGANMVHTIRNLVDHGIHVMGHIGLLPQSAPDEGGYKIKGKNDEQVEQLLADAKAVEEAGAFAVVIEGVIEDAAKKITKSINIPTIGIGASAKCDGQVLVTEDMIGLSIQEPPKFVKRYIEIEDDIAKAAEQYAKDVRARRFPFKKHVYTNL